MSGLTRFSDKFRSASAPWRKNTTPGSQILMTSALDNTSSEKCIIVGFGSVIFTFFLFSTLYSSTFSSSITSTSHSFSLYKISLPPCLCLSSFLHHTEFDAVSLFANFYFHSSTLLISLWLSPNRLSLLRRFPVTREDSISGFHLLTLLHTHSHHL